MKAKAAPNLVALAAFLFFILLGFIYMLTHNR